MIAAGLRLPHLQTYGYLRKILSPISPIQLPFKRSVLLVTSVGSGGPKCHFSSKAPTPPQQEPADEQPPQDAKRKPGRTSAGKKSLRRVAIEVQRSRDGKVVKKAPVSAYPANLKLIIALSQKTVSAVCAAEEYDIAHVARILDGIGRVVDPYKTDLYPQILHIEYPVQNSIELRGETTWTTGDLFVFPSGTVVAWAIPESTLSTLVSETLLPAARYPLQKLEEEDLEYVEDPKRDSSSIKGERITLGTRSIHPSSPDKEEYEPLSTSNGELAQPQSRNLDTVLAKIAFSSGLARSVKLAVLESLLEDYFESTKSIPIQLSRGGRMPFTRRFISQKTGQLLSIRAQLNLYSELTDSLPDLFWDSRHELGLEGYYDQISKALDTNIRIKILNEKMDYAQEIASVLRQHLSEAHGVYLEWIIITLIAVEVFFGLLREYKERFGERATRHQDLGKIT